MYELKKIGKAFTNNSVGTGPPSHEKRIYRAAVSQMLRNTSLTDFSHSLLHCTTRVTTYICYMYCCHNTGINRQDFKFSVF